MKKTRAKKKAVKMKAGVSSLLEIYESEEFIRYFCPFHAQVQN